MTLLEELLAQIQGDLAATLTLTGVAEEEIEQAQTRHPGHADRLWHAFTLLVPTFPLMNTGMVYRSHCRELLARSPPEPTPGARPRPRSRWCAPP